MEARIALVLLHRQDHGDIDGRCDGGLEILTPVITLAIFLNQNVSGCYIVFNSNGFIVFDNFPG